jgi:hypothetical protein
MHCCSGSTLNNRTGMFWPDCCGSVTYDAYFEQCVSNEVIPIPTTILP